MVAHRGFEPLISALRGRCPGPLDECAVPLRIADAAAPGQGAARRATRAGGLAFALAALPLLLAACSDRPTVVHDLETATPAASVDPSPTAPTGTPVPLPAVLQDTLNKVAEVRGLSAPPNLRVELIARSQLPALLARLLTDDDRAWFARTTTLYRLLGHFRKDQDYLTVYQSFGSESVLGLYSPADDALWVVHDDGETIDFANLPRNEAETLAHEFVHALQDYHFNLETGYKQIVDDLDRNLAWTSVVEGDATTFEAQYSKKYLLAPAAGRVFTLGTAPQASDVPASITRELFFPYTTGAEWVKGIVAKEGSAAVDKLLKDLPSSTAIILHPELRTNGWKPAPVTLPDLAGALGSGWKRESGGTLGEFQLRNYLQLRVRSGEAVTAAAGWQGDHYDVYVNGGQSVAAFRVAFADAGQAGEFASAQDSFLRAAGGNPATEGQLTIGRTSDGNTTVRTTRGAEVFFAIATSEDAARKAITTLLNG